MLLPFLIDATGDFISTMAAKARQPLRHKTPSDEIIVAPRAVEPAGSSCHSRLPRDGRGGRSTKKKKAVRFHSASRIFPAESRDEMTPEEKAEVWHDKAALFESLHRDIGKAKRARVARRLGGGAPPAVYGDDEEICARGIEEHLTAAGVEGRTRRRAAVRLAVLREQERQRLRLGRLGEGAEASERGRRSAGARDEGAEDAEKESIRRASVFVSTVSSIRAVQRGAGDAAVAKSILTGRRLMAPASC